MYSTVSGAPATLVPRPALYFNLGLLHIYYTIEITVQIKFYSMKMLLNCAADSRRKSSVGVSPRTVVYVLTRGQDRQTPEQVDHAPWTSNSVASFLWSTTYTSRCSDRRATTQ